MSKKNLVITIISLVVAIASLTTAIIIGVSSIPEPPPAYSEGDETGIYYYDVADGEILLTLSGGNNFTIAGPKINKTGTYTIDAEGNIVFDYVRDEDGTENAKLNGTTLTLQKGDASMPFLRKVNYTVTFNVDGGSNVAAATVVNGKTVAKPEDPTKEGYAFLGWYKDSELKNAFDFASYTVTADVTLYARWVHDQVGVGKYTVDFDLGYEGAPTYDSITTIAGLAYHVPTPTRQDYTFGGWWISDYEDGSKLSYEYTESTVFDSDTTLYAVWIQESEAKLPAPMASIVKNTIKWNAVSGATAYQVIITDPSGNEVLNTSVGTTTVNFDFANKVAGDYTVSVVAVSSNAANNSDATTRYIANKALAKVSQFQVIDGILIYNAVNGATSYFVSVDCGNPSHQHENFDNGLSNSFSLMNCPMKEDGIKITVTAKAEGYASSVSETFVYNKVLAAIDSVVYNAQADTFVWNAVPAASSYIVTVTVGDKTYTIDNGIKTSFSVAGYTGAITVSVKPVNSGYNSPAATTATCDKVTPATPTGVLVNGMTVTWNAAEGAESYEIKIGDIIRAVNGTSYDLSAEELTAGQSYAISVKSIKGAESSAYTAAVTFGYQVMNDRLTYKNNTVYWTPAIGANTYEIKVNGEVVKTVTGVSSAEIELTREGVNTIEVRFTDVSGSAWAKVEVIAHSISLYPKNNTASVFTKYYAIGDTITLPEDIVYDGYDFVDWYTSPSGAAGNGKLYVTGDSFNEHGSIALFASWTPKTYNVQVSVSEEFGVDNIDNNATFPATYTQSFTLPVPTLANTESLVFAGWFTGPGGTGDQLTDEEGNSVAAYPFSRDSVAYPYFRVILSYVMQPDNTYAVKRGPDFDAAKNVVIPTTYMGVPVTTVLENAFASRRNLVKISIPDTIKLIGVGALTGCSSLEYIDIYKVEGIHEIHYASDNGALIHYDGETVYLEVVPRKMTGTYVMSDEVQYIVSRAFQYTDIDKLVIGKGVINIAKYAFYQAHMTNVEFAEGRTDAVHLEDVAFYECRYLTDIKLPAALTLDNDSLTTVLDSLKKLSNITVDPSSTMYNSVDGMLTSKDRTQLLYVPLTINGPFTVPAGIRTIDNSVFKGRTGIDHITIPAFVQKIGNQAFAGCTSVRTIEFLGNRSSNLEIGENAFAGLTSLNSITFKGNADGSLETGSIKIGEGAFIPGSETNLYTLTFENGVNVAEIGENAFAGQTKLNHFSYGENTVIAKIGAGAFQSNSTLAKITIPKTVTSIGAGAFANCKNVTSVTIVGGETEISIGANAFQNCTQLRTVSLPKTVSNFNSAAFTGCINLRTIDIDDENPYIYSDENGVLYNEEKTTLLFYPKGLIVENEGKVENLLTTLTTLDASIFESNTDLVSIKLPASVTTIGANAFKGCTKLTSVTFGGGTAAAALSIGANAFNGCTKLAYGETGIILPEYTKTIGESAFSGCTSFTSLTIPAGVTSIGKTAFKGTAITNLTIPTGVTSIGAGAFENCKSLASVTVTAGSATLTLGDKTASTGVFKGCTALASVDLGNRVTLIGNYTFSGCTKAGGITFTNLGNVNYIGNNAFASVKITEFTIPENVTHIGNSAFSGTSLTSVIIPSKVTTIGDSAFYNVPLTGITIPTNVISLGKGAFSASAAANGKLESITFAEGGTDALTIKADVFKNQALIASIKLPARLDSFYSVTKPASGNKYLEYYDTETRFTGMTSLATIEVEVLDGYKAKFSAHDGVLYENDENGNPATLLYNPPMNTGNSGAITIPKTVTYVVRGAFYATTNLNTITFEEYATTDENYGKPLLYIGNVDDKNTSAPTASTYGKYTVFGGSTANTITKISFPSHLAGLGTYAVGATANKLALSFNPASTDITIAPYAMTKAKFETVSISGISKLGKGAFSGCVDATAISFTTTDAMTDIPAELFNGCTSLKTYTVPKSVKKINSKAFYGCTALESVSFEAENKLEVIGASAFASSGLKSIDLSVCKNLESIGVVGTGSAIGGGAEYYSFKDCSSLTSVNLSGLEKLEAITNYAFQNCTALTSFTLPESVTHLGYNILNGCSALESFNVKGNFTPAMFEINHFLGCTNLKTINFTDSPYFSTDEFGVVYDTEKTIVYRFFDGADTEINVGGVVKSYTIPASVKTIATYAFANYSEDTLALPAGLETIGDNAFHGSAIAVLNIPASVKTIGDDIFGVYDLRSGNKDYVNSTLQTVFFESGSQLEHIGEYAFYFATNLTSINLPDSVTFMGRNAFYNCSNLTQITIPAALKVIPRHAFAFCENLKTITFQEGLEKIGSDSFAFSFSSPPKSWTEDDYGSLSVKIPSTVIQIGGAAFDGNALLGSITFAEGSKLTKIGGQVGATDSELTGAGSDYVFRATKIKDITLPPLLESICSNAFATPATAKAGLSVLESVTFTGSALKSLPNNMFASCANLKSVVLSEGLESIGNNVFANFYGRTTFGEKTQLKSITIPASVASIGTNAFNGCVALESVTFANGSQLKAIPASAFANTKALKTVELPAGLETIGANAFENSSVISLTLPAGLTEIGDYAFNNSAIAGIVLPGSLKHIGNYAFNNCDSLVSVDLFGNIEYLGDYAFYDCDSLENAKPSSGLMYFGELAFGFCEKLTEAYIPDTIADLKGNPYAGCSGVTSFVLDPDNSFYKQDQYGILYDLEYTTIIYYPASVPGTEAYIHPDVNNIAPGAFAGSTIESINFPARFGTIEASCFRGCTNLTTFVIEDGITEIGESAFRDCTSLNNIVIPNSVESVGDYAFSGCTSLSNVSFNDKTGSDYYTLGTHIFDGCTSLTTAVLPNAWRITVEDATDSGMTGDRMNPGPTVAQLENNIPSYMFANSGVTTANLPARVTMLMTRGVFMNCANLSTVNFGVTQLVHAKSMLGADYFTGCTSLPASFTPPYKSGAPTPSNPGIRF